MATFDVGYTNPGGILIPAATSTDDVPHHWQGQYDGSNGGGNLNAQTTPTFASLTALTSAYASVPDAQKPALAKVTSLGYHQWIPSPYSVWIPALGKIYSQSAPAAASALSLTTGVGATTGTLVIAAAVYPQIALVSYRARVTQAGGATSADTYLNVAGTGDAYQTTTSFPGSTSVTIPVPVPGTATGGASTVSVIGGLQFNSGASGSSVAVDGTDLRYTKLTALILPQSVNVGATPF